MNGRSKSKIACAIRHCCAGKAKKFYVVPKMVAMDGKISNKKVCQMPLTKFVPWQSIKAGTSKHQSLVERLKVLKTAWILGNGDVSQSWFLQIKSKEVFIFRNHSEFAAGNEVAACPASLGEEYWFLLLHSGEVEVCFVMSCSERI